MTTLGAKGLQQKLNRTHLTVVAFLKQANPGVPILTNGTIKCRNPAPKLKLPFVFFIFVSKSTGHGFTDKDLKSFTRSKVRNAR